MGVGDYYCYDVVFQSIFYLLRFLLHGVLEIV